MSAQRKYTPDPDSPPLSSPGRRPKRAYHKQTAKQVAAKLRSSKWTGRALLPDVFRIANGKAQAAFLWSIYFWTEGEPHVGKNWKAPEWTPYMPPEDFAAECGLSRPSMIAAQDDAVERGLVARMADTGPDRHRYKLLRSEWPAMPNEDMPVIAGKKGPKRETGGGPDVLSDDEVEDSEDDFVEEEDTSGPTRVGPPTRKGTPVRVPVGEAFRLVPPKKGAVLAFRPIVNQTQRELDFLPGIIDGKDVILVEEPAAAEIFASAAAAVSNGAFVANAGTYGPTRVGGPTRNLPAPNGNGNGKNGHGAAGAINLANYPDFCTKVRRIHFATDDDMLRLIVSRSFDAVRMIGFPASPEEVVTDESLCAVIDAVARPRKSSAVYADTVPSEISRRAAKVMALQSASGSVSQAAIVEESEEMKRFRRNIEIKRGNRA